MLRAAQVPIPASWSPQADCQAGNCINGKDLPPFCSQASSFSPCPLCPHARPHPGKRKGSESRLSMENDQGTRDPASPAIENPVKLGQTSAIQVVSGLCDSFPSPGTPPSLPPPPHHQPSGPLQAPRSLSSALHVHVPQTGEGTQKTLVWEEAGGVGTRLFQEHNLDVQSVINTTLGCE